jgi:hypothetical protein
MEARRDEGVFGQMLRADFEAVGQWSRSFGMAPCRVALIKVPKDVADFDEGEGSQPWP